MQQHVPVPQTCQHTLPSTQDETNNCLHTLKGAQASLLNSTLISFSTNNATSKQTLRHSQGVPKKQSLHKLNKVWNKADKHPTL